MFLGDGSIYERWTMGVMTLGSVLIPCSLVFSLTGFILSCLYRAHNRRVYQMEGQKTRTNSSGVASRSPTNKIEKQLTVTLLAVAVAFLVLRTPYIVTYFVKEYQVANMPNRTHLAKVRH